MKRIIVIGQSVLEIDFKGGKPTGTRPGGELLRIASLLGKSSRGGGDTGVSFISEASLDRVGDLLVDYLAGCNVDVKSIDRYSDGVTPINVVFAPDEDHRQNSVVGYSRDSDEGFDVVWPRIDAGDIVVFGGVFAIDLRIRRQLPELLEYASTRKAIIIYVPSLEARDVPRVTRIMPSILENLEIADLVVARPEELELLFGSSDVNRCYERNVSFYCPALLVAGQGEVNYFGTGDVLRYDKEARFSSFEALTSALVKSITFSGLKRDDVAASAVATRKELLELALKNIEGI